MKTILTIHYMDFLFPDETTAAKALAMLAKAVPVRGMPFHGKLEMDDDRPLKMEVITKPFKLVKKDSDEEVDGPAPRGKARKELPQARFLQLEDRKS